MSNIFEDAFKGLFGSDADAASDAAQSAAVRTTTAIEIINRNTDLARDRLQQGTTSAIATIDRTVADIQRQLFESGNSALTSLEDGRRNAREQFDSSAKHQLDLLTKGFNIANSAINKGAGAANSAIRGGLSRALAAVKGAAGKSLEQFSITREGIEDDLNPFIETGQRGLARAEQLTNDPNAQKEFIENNPFFNSLADDAQRRIFGNAAAKGKIGSGGTKAALQNQLVLLGADLVNQSISQNFNIADRGLTASIEKASANTRLDQLVADALQFEGGSIANLESQAAGRLADVSVNQGGQLADVALTLSDLAARTEQNRGDQAGLNEIRFGENQANTINDFTKQYSSITGQGGTFTANALLDLAGQDSAIIENAGLNVSRLLTGLGEIESAGILGVREGEKQSFNDLLNVGTAVAGAVAPGSTFSNGLKTFAKLR